MQEITGKRAQILAAAEYLFSKNGFDRTSVDDLRQEAGVSKGTIYAYFHSKEALFRAVCEEVYDRLFLPLTSASPAEEPSCQWLMRFGMTFSRLMTSEPAILADRTLIAVADHMPEFGKAFFESGFRRGLGVLTQFIRHYRKIGELEAQGIARPLLELFLSGLHRERLFGLMTEKHAHARVPTVVEQAIATIFPDGVCICRSTIDACQHPTTCSFPIRLSCERNKQTGERE